MGALVSLFGCVLLLLLTLSGLLLIVAPTLGKRILQKTAAGAGLLFLLLCALNLVWQLLRSINPLLFILGVTALSTVAYFVRERLIGAPQRRDGPHPVERTPVMPRHIPGDGQ
jgi:hypothetical protein